MYLRVINCHESLQGKLTIFENLLLCPIGVSCCQCFVKTQNSSVQVPDARQEKEVSVYLTSYCSSVSLWWIVKLMGISCAVHAKNAKNAVVVLKINL